MGQMNLDTISSPTSVQEIFKSYVQKQSIFKNKRALDSSFIPSEIPHREKHIRQIGAILAPSLKGFKPSNIFIYGSVGTGKSITARYVINELESVAKQNERNVKTIYVNCKLRKVADTEYRLMAKLLRELGIRVPDTGIPTDVLYRKFFRAIDIRHQVLILVLDEIDTLVRKVGDEFLYNLTRINTELTKAKLSLIGITNDLSFTENLDARVKSSLGEEEIIFPHYNALELRDILKKRSEEAFHPNMLDDSVINKCAALAAQEHGDARRGLDLLRVAGEIAERLNESRVKEKHVDMAQQKIDLDRVIEIVKTQPKQSQLVLYAVMKLNGKKHKFTGDVFEVYENICNKNGMKPLTQRRISDLLSELDMLGIITSKIVSKGRYGRSRQISLAINDRLSKRIESFLIGKFGF
jgi:cell division control protein 6